MSSQSSVCSVSIEDDSHAGVIFDSVKSKNLAFLKTVKPLKYNGQRFYLGGFMVNVKICMGRKCLKRLQKMVFVVHCVGHREMQLAMLSTFFCAIM